MYFLHKNRCTRSLVIVDQLRDSELTTQLKESKGALTYGHWQILYLIQVSMDEITMQFVELNCN